MAGEILTKKQLDLQHLVTLHTRLTPLTYLHIYYRLVLTAFSAFCLPAPSEGRHRRLGEAYICITFIRSLSIDTCGLAIRDVKPGAKIHYKILPLE